MRDAAESSRLNLNHLEFFCHATKLQYATVFAFCAHQNVVTADRKQTWHLVPEHHYSKTECCVLGQVGAQKMKTVLN